jgi:hypothetical protein
MHFPRPGHPQPVGTRCRNAGQAAAHPHRLLEGFIRFRYRVPTLPYSDNESRIDEPGELVAGPTRTQEFVSGGEATEPIHIIDNVHPAKVPGWRRSRAPNGQICGELGLWITFGSACIPSCIRNSHPRLRVRNPGESLLLGWETRRNLGIQARHSWISDPHSWISDRRASAEGEGGVVVSGGGGGRGSGVQGGVQEDAGTGTGEHLDSSRARVAPEQQVRHA